MKKLLLLIILMFFSISITIGQNPYYDAITLKMFIRSGSTKFNTDSIKKANFILTKYLSNEDQTIESEFGKNNFYKYRFENFAEKGTEKVPEGGNGNNFLSTSFNAVSGLNITSLADGFSKFIVKRTKQELSTAFFEHFKDDLNDVRYKNLQLIFPQTFRTLSAIDNEIYMFDLYIQTLRESFEKDLRSLPANLPGLIDNNSNYFDHRKELKAELQTAFYIARSIQDNKHPGEMIEKYNVDDLNNLPNMKAAFQTLQLFSTSLKSNNDSSYWVSENEIKILCKDTTLLNLYLGLVLQRAKNESINFVIEGKIINLANEINNSHFVKLKINNYISYISTISSKAQSIDKKIIVLKKEKNDSVLLENYYTVISSSIDLMKYAVQTDKLPGLETVNIEKSTLPYFELAQTASDIVIDVHRGNYSLAIVNVSYIARSIDSTNSDVAQKLLKYGSFIAAIANAKNSDQVNNAIEAIALPAGSSRIKRESRSNVSLNAYCGFYGGKNIAGDWSTGLTAPIGIAASWGIYKHTSFSVLFSIFDLGAPVAFRFSNNSDSIPAIKLADIISPGLFVSWGIRKCPVSINAGCQMTPSLTSVSSKGNTFGTKSLRVTLGLLVDLPLLNLYNKSK